MQIIHGSKSAGWSGRFGWYAIRTAPRRELDVANRMRDRGVRAFVPIEIVKRRVGAGTRRRTVDVERPFFPGYLFVQTPMDVAEWLSLRRERDVCGILSAGLDGLPSPIPDRAMAHLIEHGPFREPEPPRPCLGSSVRVVHDGPFSGMAGIVDIDRRDRIRVLLRAMGSAVPVWMHAADVEIVQVGIAPAITA